METKRFRSDLALNLIILAVCIIPVIVSFFMVTDGKNTELRPFTSFSIPGSCFFKFITGYNCPFCGMTRSFIYMSSMNIRAAWDMNKAGVLLYMFCVLQLPYRSLVILSEKVPMHKYIKIAGYLYLILTGIAMIEQFVLQFITVG